MKGSSPAIKPIALLVISILASFTASAVEIYGDENNQVIVGGRLQLHVINTQGKTEMANAGSRVRFGFDHKLNNGWVIDTLFEWGVNAVGKTDLVYSSDSALHAESDDFLSNRLGYVGFSHENYGRLSFGKQWGVWYDVVGATNQGMVWDGNAAGVFSYNKGDGAINGVGRGDKIVQYRNSWGAFELAVQAQIKDELTKLKASGDPINPFPPGSMLNDSFHDTQVRMYNTYGVALGYQLGGGWKLTLGGNTGDIDIIRTGQRQQQETDYIYGMGISYGCFGCDGLFAAANYNHNAWHDTDNLGRMLPKSQGVETWISYQFINGLRPFISYNMLDAGAEYASAYGGDEFKRQFVFAGLHYQLDRSVTLFLEARKDCSEIHSSLAGMADSEDDGAAIGVQYNF